MSIIDLSYGNATFNSDDLVRYLQKVNRNYIIQGQVNCVRRAHPIPHSLDCWLRDNYAKNPDTKQAVNEVIDDLIATGDFAKGYFKCPDSGRNCKGIQLTDRKMA